MAKKKVYQKPQIKQVNLVPEEAVLAGCKVATDPGAIGKGGNICGGASPVCQEPGS